MEDKKNPVSEEEKLPTAADENAAPPVIAPDDDHKPYIPRPKYQLVIAWVLLTIMVVSVALWLLEIGTGGKLFGLLG